MNRRSFFVTVMGALGLRKPLTAALSKLDKPCLTTSAPSTLEMDNFARKYLEPSIIALSKQIDEEILNSHVVGTGYFCIRTSEPPYVRFNA